jgi:peptidoglycan hydrolase CwlO-like protein
MKILSENTRRTVPACLIGLILLAFSICPPVSSADSGANDIQSQIDSATEQMIILNKKIADYQAQLKQAGSAKKTLQAQIKILDLQRDQLLSEIAGTNLQISVSKLKIVSLVNQVQNIQKKVADSQAQIALLLRELDRQGNESLLVRFLTAGNFSNFLQNINNIFDIEKAFGQKINDLQAAQAVLSASQTATKQQQQALTDQNNQLASQQQALSSTTQSKNQLLAVTKNKESNYQALLAKAEKQLKSYATFIQNAGGAKILGNETVCDSWGCYYNQRDSAWGAKALNGTEYTLATDGCLVTSMAMVLTHYGYRNVTPLTINSNPNNFASYFPAFLLNTIAVDGISATRVSAVLDSNLANGTPIIVELSVYGGTHFVVLVSGNNGKYLMRDPYIAHGKDISFNSHYNVKEIAAIERVVIGN